MWKFIKSLFKKEQKVEETVTPATDNGVRMLFIYPQTQIELPTYTIKRNPKPVAPKPEPVRTAIQSYKDWVDNARQVNALYARMSPAR